MTKKKTANKSNTEKGSSPVIHKICVLLEDKKNLSWANAITAAEVTFLYDLAAKSQAQRNFSPTEKQSRWAIEILKKIDLIRSTTK